MFSILGGGAANSTARWQPEPNVRGTFSILSACIMTLGLCAWSALHLNVPEFGKANRQFWVKTRWLLCVVFAPEVVAWVAFEQWRQVTKLDNFMKETLGDSPPFPWSRVHSHLALMGGFAFDTGGDPSIPLPQPRYTLTPRGICFLAERRPDLMPNLTTDAINDKSKASPFAKSLVLAQALWFCLQIITRLAMGLPISALELNTLAHVVFAFCAFAAWWYKPLDIYEPILISLANNPSAASLCAAMYLRSTIGYQQELWLGTSKCLLECSWPLPDSDVGPNLKPEETIDDQGQHTITIEPRTPDIPAVIRLKTGERKQGFQFRYTEGYGKPDSHGDKTYEWDVESRWPKTLEISGQTQRCCWLAQESILKHSPLQDQPFRTLTYEDDDTGEPVHVAYPERDQDYLTLTSSNWPQRIQIGTTTLKMDTETALVRLVASGVLYGGIHLLGWNGSLHSESELTLWRVASLTLVVFGALVGLGLAIVYLDEALEDSWFNIFGLLKSLMGFIMCLTVVVAAMPIMAGCVFYLFSRVYLVIEGLISLPFVSDEVYLQPRWANYFPHIA